MAWQSRQLYRIDVWLIDYDRTRLASTGVYVSAATPLPDVEAFAFAYADRINNACTAGIHKVTMRTHNYSVPHEQPAASSEVTRAAALVFATELADHRSVIWLPGLDDSLLLAAPDPWAGIRIDQAAPAVADLVAFLLAGDGTVRVCSPERKVLTSLSAAYYQFRDTRVISYRRQFRGWG